MKTILQAAIHAPSARNTQPWRITALAGPEKIAHLDEAVKTASKKPGFDHYASFVSSPGYAINFQTAPVFIIVSVDRDRSAAPREDGALALANIMLAARALNLGTCWVNQLGVISDEPDFRAELTALGLPESHVVIGCAALGHPARLTPKAPERRPDLFCIVK